MKYLAIVLMLAGGYFIFSGSGNSSKTKKKKPSIVKTEVTEDYSDFVEAEVNPKKENESSKPSVKKAESDDADFASIDNSSKLNKIK